LAPESVILKGLDVTYSSYNRSKIRTWLDGIALYQQTADVHTIKSTATGKNKTYTLNGQQTAPNKKGILIQNGEKRIIR
jgi:hypothetical protein